MFHRLQFKIVTVSQIFLLIFFSLFKDTIKEEKTLANTILVVQWFVTIEQILSSFYTVSSRLVMAAQDQDSRECIQEFPHSLIGLEKRLLKIKN